MKLATVKGVKQAGVIEVPDPKPKESWALVKVMAAPMCTEFKNFVGGGFPGRGQGHEAAGEVVAVAQPCRVKPGDRVVVQPSFPCGKCQACVQGEYIHCASGFDYAAVHGSDSGKFSMGQYVLQQDWLLSPIPDGVDFDRASLAVCALGPTFGACEKMDVSAFDTVLITGLGPVGLGGVVNARHRGARVIGVESVPYRQKLALELGAEQVIDPVDEQALNKILNATSGQGANKAIDTSGAQPAHRLCLEATSRFGQVTMVGQSKAESAFGASKHLIQKGLTLRGAWHYNLADYPRVMEVIQKSPAAARLITHTFPIGEIQKAWETQASGECGKIILHPWE
jgi:L-iditol 2-dehydrogenase